MTEETKPEERRVHVCSECNSCQVQSQLWVETNSHNVLDDTGHYDWCDNCDNETTLDWVPVSQCSDPENLPPEHIQSTRQVATDLLAAAEALLAEHLEEVVALGWKSSEQYLERTPDSKWHAMIAAIAKAKGDA